MLVARRPRPAGRLRGRAARAPPPDAGAYERIAENLHRDGSFDARPGGVAREVQPTSAYSPGLPLLVAGVYWAQRRRPPDPGPGPAGAARRRAAIPLAYLLGRALRGPLAGLIGAGVDRHLPGAARVPGAAADRAAGGDFLLSRDRSSRSSGRPTRAPARAPWRWLGRGRAVRPARPGPPRVPGRRRSCLPLVWLGRARRLRGSARRGSLAPAAVVAAGDGARPRALDDPQRGRPRPLRADLDRRRQGALHRHLPRRRRRRAEAARSCCSPNGRPCGRGSNAGGPVDDPDRFVLERVLGRVAAESYPGLETDAALGAAGPPEPRRRRHRGAAALRRHARRQGLRNLDRRGARRDARASPGGRCSSAIVLLALAGPRDPRLAAAASRRWSPASSSST